MVGAKESASLGCREVGPSWGPGCMVSEEYKVADVATLDSGHTCEAYSDKAGHVQGGMGWGHLSEHSWDTMVMLESMSHSVYLVTVTSKSPAGARTPSAVAPGRRGSPWCGAAPGPG